MNGDRPCRCYASWACCGYFLTLLAQIKCLHILCALHSLHQFLPDLHAMRDTNVSWQQLPAVVRQMKVTCSACPRAAMAGRSMFRDNLSRTF